MSFNTNFDNITPWNGQNDTGKDVRLKWQNNLEKITKNFQEIEKNYLHGDVDATISSIFSFIKGIKINNKSLLDIIGSTDKTDASDDTVYSSLKTLKTFLRRDKEDSTDFLMKFLGGIITTCIQSKDFVTGQLGAGYELTSENGKSRLEVDELLVRVKAIFTSLKVRKLNYIGDNLLSSAAGCKIGKVEETDTTYKCYFLADDGTTATTNDFVVGDQARCQTFNIKAGKYTNVSNKYYWRLVTAVGDDYIELSKTDCDTNSDVPAAGDALVQLGNRTDTSRQNAIMIVVTGENAPAFIQYKAIAGYTLSGKDQTVISPSGNKFTGSFNLSTGGSVLDYADNAANQAKKDAQGYANSALAGAKQYADAQIKVQSDSITETVGKVDTLNGRVNTAEEKLTPTAINLAVKSQTEAIAATAANSIGKFYVRGSGLNHNIAPSVQLNGVEYASSYGRGHTLITINRSNLSKVELINYDTYGSSTYCDNLAAKLNSLSSDVIIVLVSFDACSIDSSLADSLKNCGGSGKTFGADRIPNAFIGIQGIGAGNGIEVICGNGATDPYAEYSTIITGGIPQGVMGANCALNRMLSSFTIDTSGISLLGKKISLAGIVTFNSLDGDSQNRIINAANAANNAQGTANTANDKAGAAQNNLDTLNGRLRGLAFTDKALDAMRNEGIIAGAYMNMAYLDVKTIVANGINAQTIDANNATFRNLNVENATLKNVQISGSIRSPFLWVDGNNVPAGGYTLTNNIALQGTNMTITSSLDKVGKRVTVSSVRYPNGNYIDGIYTIKASDGSPFYEDGITKSQITISREIVELLGYGTETQFFGWIVLNRRNVYTAHKYGYQHLVMYEGFVNDDGSMYKHKSFDGGAVSSVKTGDGYYRVTIPSTPVSEYLVLLGNYSHIAGAGRYASVYNRQSTYFEVYTGDDSTSNTGPFYFQVISTADWS
jgi:hypothetical protein